MVRLKVTGMSCGGCAAAVRKAVVAAAPGATVEVDLSTGEIRVDGLDEAGVREAVRRAGYAAVDQAT